MQKKKSNSYIEFLDVESRNPQRKDTFLYLCDYKRKIKDGKCSGENCFYTHGDTAINSTIFNCKHTYHEKYAKNSSKRYFLPIPCQWDRDLFIEVSKDEIDEKRS